MVYNGEDGVVPMLLWESCDKVCCDLLKWECIFVGRDTVEGYFLSVCNDLVLLAIGTSFYIVGYPLAHPYPAVYFSCFSDCFISSWMSSCGMIVYKSH